MSWCVTHAGVVQGEVAQGASARSLTLLLPLDLESTTLGELVKCTYTINVQLKARAFAGVHATHLLPTMLIGRLQSCFWAALESATRHNHLPTSGPMLCTHSQSAGKHLHRLL